MESLFKSTTNLIAALLLSVAVGCFGLANWSCYWPGWAPERRPADSSRGWAADTDADMDRKWEEYHRRCEASGSQAVVSLPVGVALFFTGATGVAVFGGMLCGKWHEWCVGK